MPQYIGVFLQFKLFSLLLAAVRSQAFSSGSSLASFTIARDLPQSLAIARDHAISRSSSQPGGSLTSFTVSRNHTWHRSQSGHNVAI
jgi:hypothetical protein